MKLPASGYVTAEASRKPGYLAKRFSKLIAEAKAKRAEADRQNAENMREAAVKVVRPADFVARRLAK